MIREEKINQTQHKMFIVSGLQMYGYELSLLIKIIELQMTEQYVGIEEIESMLLIHTLAFEKILKISIIAVDPAISEKKLRNLSHSIKDCFQFLVELISKNFALSKAINTEIAEKDFVLFIDILDELSTVKRRYDKLDLALGKEKSKKGIIDNKIDYIVPKYMDINTKVDKEVLSYIYVNSLVFIYIIELILGEERDGLHQQSLVSLFEMKYKLTVLNTATIDRKIELLQQRKIMWKKLLI